MANIQKEAIQQIEEPETKKTNTIKVNDLEFIVTKENALYQEFTIIRKGKKKYYVIKHK